MYLVNWLNVEWNLFFGIECGSLNCFGIQGHVIYTKSERVVIPSHQDKTGLPELNWICRILRREVCQEVKVGSLTTYSACTIPHYGYIRSTRGEVTNIPISEDFSSCKSCWALETIIHSFKYQSTRQNM